MLGATAMLVFVAAALCASLLMLGASATLVPVAAALCAWLVMLYVRNRRYWADRGVPHDKPHWLFGSLNFLLKDSASKWMISLSRKFKSPYVGVWVFHKPALVVQSPELIRRILVKDADNFRDRYASASTSGDFNLFLLKDPMWTSIRRRLTVIFTASRLRSLHTLVNTKSQELVQRFRTEVDSGKPFDIRSIYTDYTTDVIGTAAFGVESNATLKGDGPMRRITRDFQHFTYMRAVGWGSIFFLPQVANIFRFSFFPKDTIVYLHKVWQAVIQQRGGYDQKVTDTKDLVDALIKIKQEANDDGQALSEDVLVAQAAIFLMGGFETTSSQLSFLTLELAHQPHIQDKLYQEIWKAKQNHGDKELDMTVFSELPYLNAVIKESLRKYNTMGWFDRVASRDYKIDDNLTITAGTPVWANGIGLHYNPDIYPDPETFDPDRFLPENEKNIQPHSYMPFGDGPRICIGNRFALVSLSYVVSKIFYNFKVTPKPGCMKPNDFPWSNKNILIVPGEIIPVDFIPRNE